MRAALDWNSPVLVTCASLWRVGLRVGSEVGRLEANALEDGDGLQGGDGRGRGALMVRTWSRAPERQHHSAIASIDTLYPMYHAGRGRVFFWKENRPRRLVGDSLVGE